MKQTKERERSVVFLSSLPSFLPSFSTHTHANVVDCSGRKHKSAVRDYYAQFEENVVQAIIDTRVREYEAREAAIRAGVWKRVCFSVVGMFTNHSFSSFFSFFSSCSLGLAVAGNCPFYQCDATAPAGRWSATCFTSGMGSRYAVTHAHDDAQLASVCPASCRSWWGSAHSWNSSPWCCHCWWTRPYGGSSFAIPSRFTVSPSTGDAFAPWRITNASAWIPSFP